MQYLDSNCNARKNKPHVTPLMVKQEIEKRVPRPGVGIAPAGGKTLVNLQTVLWVDTPADRDLGTVTLLGRFRVALRIHVDHVDWSFGDGATDRTSTPGKPYEDAEHCTTARCPGHYGHIYRATGDMTISARVSWTGQYSINGGAWQDVPGVVTGPAQASTITVLAARGVLVAPPGSD